MADRIQVLGLCRFSYPANLNAFQTRHADMAERTAALYDPARLDVRCFLFEQFLLPAMAAQTDPDFTLILLMGDDFPEPWRSRMLTHCKAHPQLSPVFHPSGQPHREVYREVLHAHRDPDAMVVSEFRLDDDDAVAVDFVERLRTLFPRHRPTLREFNKLAIEFTRGMVVEPTADGIAYSPVVAHLWTPGLAVCHRPAARNTVMDFAHLKLWQTMPVASYPDRVMFLRGMHGTNDSTVELRGTGTYKWPEDGAAGVLTRRFAVDAGVAAQKWQALQAR